MNKLVKIKNKLIIRMGDVIYESNQNFKGLYC